MYIYIGQGPDRHDRHAVVTSLNVHAFDRHDRHMPGMEDMTDRQSPAGWSK